MPGHIAALQTAQGLPVRRPGEGAQMGSSGPALQSVRRSARPAAGWTFLRAVRAAAKLAC